jgi:tetratricopeptide (TPR) repeat protein/serine/threonine protein kinase
MESPLAALSETVDEAGATERPGTVIGPYKLLEQIGEGGFGVVFMAEQQQPIRRKVALKLIKPGMDTRQVIARFEAERQALALMDHPNIAKVLDAGQTPPAYAGGSLRPYFVMDLVKGLPITEFCDQARLPIRERLELFLSVCQAVQHAHQKGIIHRDIKPSNVLVTLHDGTPLAKVIDFGIAKALGQELTDKTLYTAFAQLIGTPLYMSPEQAAFSNIDVDTRSDIYSLGVLLYELLTGTTPCDKERLHQAGYDEMRRIIREEEPPKPSTRISTLSRPRLPSGTGPAQQAGPTCAADTATLATIAANRQSDPKRLGQFFRAELDWIVMKCLEKDRDRRYETANGLARDIQRYLHDEPVQACPPSPWYKFRKFARRKKTALVIATCVFVALAGMAAVVGWAVRDRVARDHDQAAREEALDKEVERLLEEAGPLIELGKWPEALAAVERADKLLAFAGRTERPAQLLDLQRDLSMAQRLEDIYRDPRRDLKTPVFIAAGQVIESTSQPEHARAEEEFFWGREQDARFSKAFRDFGIDMDALSPADAAARIGRTSVPQALVRALDEWAPMRKRARGGDDPFWKKLLEIAQQSDPDEWRSRVREALQRRDRPALEKLAYAVPIREVSPATVYLLGHVLKDFGALDKAMAVLRAAHRYHPDDFWINDALGFFSKDLCRPPRYDDALRYYSMCLALRPQNVHTHRAVAQLLEAKGALDEAIAEYSKAIELDPKHAPAWNSRGWTYIELRQYDKAVADYSKVIELDPKVALAWFNRGFAYNTLHQYDKALADYCKVIELDAKNAMAWNNRGWTYLQLHQYDKAVADYSKVIELDPKNAWAWHGRGLAHIDLHQYDKAVADYSKVIELDPKNAEAWHNRGFAYNRLHQYDEALANANKAIELDPKFARAWNNRGNAYVGLRQYEKAIADYSKAIERDPKLADVWVNRGNTYLDLHQYDKAVADYSKVIELDPKNAVAWHNRGFAYNRLHQYDEALANANKAIELDPKFARAWNNRGNAYVGLRQYEKAIADYSKAIERDPKLADVCENRGNAYINLHQYDKAIPDFAKAIELDPKNAGLRNNLAWLLATCPEPKFWDASEAVAQAKKAVELAPREGTLRNTLGVALYRAGEWQAAVEALSKSDELLKGNMLSFNAFFLAMAHWQLGERDKPRQWYDKAVQWMEQNQPNDEELRRFRAEAATLLGIEAKQAGQEKKKPPAEGPSP